MLGTVRGTQPESGNRSAWAAGEPCLNPHSHSGQLAAPKTQECCCEPEREMSLSLCPCAQAAAPHSVPATARRLRAMEEALNQHFPSPPALGRKDVTGLPLHTGLEATPAPGHSARARLAAGRGQQGESTVLTAGCPGGSAQSLVCREESEGAPGSSLGAKHPRGLGCLQRQNCNGSAAARTAPTAKHQIKPPPLLLLLLLTSLGCEQLPAVANAGALTRRADLAR